MATVYTTGTFDIFVIGNDWEGKFDELKDVCKVVYLPRTDGISSAELKDKIHEA